MGRENASEVDVVIVVLWAEDVDSRGWVAIAMGRWCGKRWERREWVVRVETTGDAEIGLNNSTVCAKETQNHPWSRSEVGWKKKVVEVHNRRDGFLKRRRWKTGRSFLACGPSFLGDATLSARGVILA